MKKIIKQITRGIIITLVIISIFASGFILATSTFHWWGWSAPHNGSQIYWEWSYRHNEETGKQEECLILWSLYEGSGVGYFIRPTCRILKEYE
jgi:hypothetical protein